MRLTSGLYLSGVLGALALSLAACGEPEDVATNGTPAEPIVKTVKVEAQALALQRSYPAVIQPAREVSLAFEVSGRIVNLPIRAAMEVQEGDIIAELDKSDFQANLSGLENQKAQAEAQLRGMVAGARAEDIASLQASVDAAQAQVDQARDQFARTAELLERGVTTVARRDQDRASLQVAEANLRSAEEELSKGRAGSRAEDVDAQEAAIAALEAQLETARKSLADATLRAPFSGIIARREVDNFTNIQAGSPIALLQQLDRIELVFDVPGPDVAKFADAEEVSSQVEINARPGEFLPAELVEFSTQADQTTQTFRGRVGVDRPEGRGVLPGMIGTVLVSDATARGETILVPTSAVAAAPDGGSFVWRVDESANTVSRVTVELGEARGDSIFVTGGLESGDVVVTAGLARLQPDMKVRPVTEIGS
ncbi:MAG: efflux RND transporter periplasmic adaptor subunit [Pseudomonadota bacterium]